MDLRRMVPLAIAAVLICSALPARSAEAPIGTLAFERLKLPFESQNWHLDGATPSDIYALHADGNETQLTGGGLFGQEMHPAWSPDGRSLAYTNSDSYDLVIINADGEETARIESPEGHYYYWPTWSPDGGRLAFHRWDSNESKSRILTVRADGTGLKMLTFGQDFSPSWSPDGKWIAFAGWRDQGPLQARHLYIVRPDGSQLRRLTTGSLEVLRPVWSPDGSRIAFMAWLRGSAAGQVAFYDTDIYVTRVNGKPRRLTGGPEYDFYPCWSPDGTTIAFPRAARTIEFNGVTGWPYNTVAADLFTVPADGGQPTQLTHTPTTSEGACTWKGS